MSREDNASAFLTKYNSKEVAVRCVVRSENTKRKLLLWISFDSIELTQSHSAQQATRKQKLQIQIFTSSKTFLLFWLQPPHTGHGGPSWCQISFNWRLIIDTKKFALNSRAIVCRKFTISLLTHQVDAHIILLQFEKFYSLLVEFDKPFPAHTSRRVFCESWWGVWDDNQKWEKRRSFFFGWTGSVAFDNVTFFHRVADCAIVRHTISIISSNFLSAKIIATHSTLVRAAQRKLWIVISQRRVFFNFIIPPGPREMCLTFVGCLLRDFLSVGCLRDSFFFQWNMRNVLRLAAREHTTVSDLSSSRWSRSYSLFFFDTQETLFSIHVLSFLSSPIPPIRSMPMFLLLWWCGWILDTKIAAFF